MKKQYKNDTGVSNVKYLALTLGSSFTKSDETIPHQKPQQKMNMRLIRRTVDMSVQRGQIGTCQPCQTSKINEH